MLQSSFITIDPAFLSPVLARVVDPYHQIIINTHVRRFRQTYVEYFQDPKTQALADYFFQEIYTLEGKEERDKLAVKTYQRFKGMLTAKSRERIEKLLYLNEITDSLDFTMAQIIRKEPKFIVHADGLDFVDFKKLASLYRKANPSKERVNQLELVLVNLESFFDLSKHPLAPVIIRPVSLAARAVGAIRLFRIFEQGYNATKPISKEVFFDFTAHVRQNEILFLEKIYKKRIKIP